MTRLRRASSLVVTFEAERVVVQNFLSKKGFVATTAAIELLASASDWTPIEAFFDMLKSYSRSSVGEQLENLVRLSALVVEGSPFASRDEDYARDWVWGAVAGHYHFSIKNERFADEHEAEAILRERIAEGPSPPLFSRSEAPDAVRLPRPGARTLLDVMRRRRSRRDMVEVPIPAAGLATCLYAGLGITGFIRDALLGELPVKTSPSGGARNPYEGFVYVRNVAGLNPGIYHYSGVAHSLEQAAAPPFPMPGNLLARQEWADRAGAIIFLVANLSRTTWKYRHPSSYRVVLIEAGHIVQNIMLAATAQGLVTVPTCALHDAEIEAVLDLDEMRQAVVYAVALGTVRGS